MDKLLTKKDIEPILRDYISQNTPKNYSEFNPIRLELGEIARNTELEREIVEKTLKSLSEENEIVEEIGANFKFWLPLNKNGKSIKNKLYQNNLAYHSLALFSFLLITAIFYLLKLMVSKGYLNLQSSGDYFWAGVIITGASISLAKLISNKFYFGVQWVKNIKYYKWYVWSFIFFTGAIIYIVNKGMKDTVIFIITLLADLVTVIGFFVVEIKNFSNKDK